jgi:hypothetical protein
MNELKNLKSGLKSKALINVLSADLLPTFDELPLLNKLWRLSVADGGMEYLEYSGFIFGFC